METSIFVDIFATKGIEYLFILAFFPVLIFFWRQLNLPSKPAASKQPETSPAPWCSLQEGLFYHQGHSWVRPEDDDMATVGIDDFTQRLLGISSAIEIPLVGGNVRQGEKGWGLKLGSKEIGILSPVKGTVIAVNEDVLRHPHLLNQDPYGEGWLMKVKVPEMKRNLANLLSGELAVAWMKATVENIEKRVTDNFAAVLEDGDVPVEGIARKISPEGWEEIAGDFLLTR